MGGKRLTRRSANQTPETAIPVTTKQKKQKTGKVFKTSALLFKTNLIYV